MINFIRKYFDRKFNKPIMYILPAKFSNNGIIYKLIIHGENLKEYRITLKNINSSLYTIILSIILLEDISTIYCDCWNTTDVMEICSYVRWIKLKKWINDNQLEKAITKDNIIDIQIN